MADSDYEVRLKTTGRNDPLSLWLRQEVQEVSLGRGRGHTRRNAQSPRSGSHGKAKSGGRRRGRGRHEGLGQAQAVDEAPKETVRVRRARLGRQTEEHPAAGRRLMSSARYTVAITALAQLTLYGVAALQGNVQAGDGIGHGPSLQLRSLQPSRIATRYWQLHSRQYHLVFRDCSQRLEPWRSERTPC